MTRPATGNVTAVYDAAGESVMGVFYRQDNAAVHTALGYGVGYSDLYFDISRKTPVGNANKPRAWGALACAYLGQPAYLRRRSAKVSARKRAPAAWLVGRASRHHAVGVELVLIARVVDG